MNKNSYIKILLTIITFTIFISNAQAADITAGEQIFNNNCTACHSGGNNVLMPEKTLKKDTLIANEMYSIDAITTQVNNGKNAMPAFGGRLSDEDIDNVANYVINQADQGW